MEQSVVMDIARRGMETALMVSLPIMAVTLFVGLLVSVFQAVTQVQEMTLTFVPKLIGIGLVIMLMGNWMLTLLVQYMQLCFAQASRMGQ